jgi:protein-ribulosamine 3-kinase
MTHKLSPHLVSAIRDATGRAFEIRSAIAVGGGSINDAFTLEGNDGECYFLKLNDRRHHAMFAAETAGLAAIAATAAIRVPQVIAHGVADDQSYLVLECLKLTARGNDGLLGEQLAALHRCMGPSFGYTQDNFIGTSAQPNAWNQDWINFWREQRLGFQLQLAAANGYGGQLRSLGEKLLDALPSFFDGYVPAPSLLHGDLWSGNHAFLADGMPVVFDPAAYFGDRECDLAMTELFGGYSANFYAAYRGTWPLNAGYVLRRDLYNLYHILNHANLFGGGYARQAEQMMRTLLQRAG